MYKRQAIPLAFLIAGPLADNVFEPLLAVDGPLANSVGQIIGVGPGRGMAFMLVVFGIAIIAIAIAAYQYRPLRNIEKELPDMLPEEELVAINLREKKVSHASA